MMKSNFFLIALILLAIHSYPQMYILNEDFSEANGTVPPAGWTNNTLSGNTNDLWHFDNPGDRFFYFPITEPFAIFDSDTVSANGQPESASLTTPVFDASISNFILLQLDHTFEPGNGGIAKIEAFDGSDWQEIVSYNTSSTNPSSDMVDISSITGGITNARIRFVWQGNSTGFWAIDNIRIYASLPLDGGIVSIFSPLPPISPGIQDVRVNLGNFGYNTITSTTIHWTVDGIPQPPFDWFGSAGFGQTVEGITIGTYDFQSPVLLKIWQSNPNGQADPNPYNDTIIKYIETTLCGIYTVGGSDPDFINFSQVAQVLNNAGVTCPVTFLVRDGIYYEQFMLGPVPGSSEINTVTFRSESGDSTMARIQISPGALKYEPMIYLNGSQNIVFEDLSLVTGSNVSYSNIAVLLNNAQNVRFKNCYFEVRNQFDYAVTIQGGSQRIDVYQSRFESVSNRSSALNIKGNLTKDINIQGNFIRGATEWGYSTIRIADNASEIDLKDNSIDRCSRAVYIEYADSVRITGNLIQNSNSGIFIYDGCAFLEISGNKLLQIKGHPSVPDGTSAIYLHNSTNIDIFNNFLQTSGDGTVMGISLSEAESCRIFFNSLNLANDDTKNKSKGIYLDDCNQILARNNISYFKYSGSPVYLEESSLIDFDYNDYYSPDKTIGYVNGDRYTDLQAWSSFLNMDFNTLSVPPFYTSDTDLSMNQVLLNNAGIPVAGINVDIDGTLRDPVSPDLGAREYDLCLPDAGINEIVSPVNPLNTGTKDVSVLLQNQGSGPLSSVTINWQVNGEMQIPHTWFGTLAAGANIEVTIGQYNFQSGIIYVIKAWSLEPNELPDCNPVNDSIFGPELAAPLCGIYTVAGSNPDFTTLEEASKFLNMAGVTCSVTLLVRDGIYYEQFVLGDIAGSSAVNTITIRSENGDSSLAIINIDQGSVKFEPIIYLDGSKHIRIEGLGFITGPPSSFDNYCILMEGVMDIKVEGCYFEPRKDEDLGLLILGSSTDIIIRQNRFDCISARAGAMDISGQGTRDIDILDNNILGATQWDYVTIRIGSYVSKINIIGNYLERCMRSIYLVNSDSIEVRNNWINNVNGGVYIGDLCSDVLITQNRLTNINSHPNASDGISAISVRSSSNIEISNNFIHTTGDGPVIGITLQSATKSKVYFNSLNITNKDSQARSKGLRLTSSNQVTAQNNIFFLQSNGAPVDIDAYHPQLVFDRNDYYSLGGTVGYYGGIRYTDLAVWADSLNMDLNSLSVQPFYSSETDVSMNQVLLNNAAVPVPGISADIDGTLRDPVQPDIGAKEYTPCETDAGINKLIGPNNPLSGDTQDVIVVLQNQGTLPLTSVVINWQLNDVIQTPFSWSGNIGVKANQQVLIGQFDSQLGGLYSLKIWTSSPNNSPDCNHINDTLSSLDLVAPLCGVYTVGGEDPDFNNLGETALALNSAGITCPVTFMIRDGIYYEHFIIEPVKGSSSENTVTFQSESGDNTLAVVKLHEGAVKFEPMIFLRGSKNITFSQLGILSGNATSESNTVVLMENCENITLHGCNIEAKKDYDVGVVISKGSKIINIEQCMISCISSKAGAINITDSETRGIEVRSNIIKGSVGWGYTMIRIGSNVNKVNLVGNSIERSNRSIYLIQSDSITISDNVIRNTNEGIYVDDGCSVLDISSNWMYNIKSLQNAPEGTNGIFLLNTIKADVINNFVHTFGDGPSIGINLQNADSCRLHYNSVNITNNDVLGKSKGIILSGTDQLTARNNLINIKSVGAPIQCISPFNNLSIDYSNYYNPIGTIGVYDGQVYTNLFQWGQMINGDANSKAVNPYFKADTIPLPFQRALNGAGIPIPGILYDIDGKVRFAQAPDIGCMEFFVDYGILDLLSPTLNCFHTEIDSVTVYIRQYGDLPFEELKIAYQLNDGPVHYDTIPGPLLFDVTHTFETTENISAFGDYLFKVWLINTLDDNINNDTLYAWRYSKPPPEVSFTYDNFCTGPEVFFFGQASVVEPYFIESYEWLFGDGDTSTLQNPAHTYSGTGTYNVTFRAYSDAGCYSEIILPVFIDPEFQVLEMDYNIVNETCLGDGTGSLEILASGEYPPFTFFIDGVQITGNTVSGFPSGKHEIRIVDSENCSIVDSIEVFPEIWMQPAIQAEPLSGLSPLTVDFDFTVNYADSWRWHFDDGATDTNKNASYTFLTFGSHLVVLEVNSGPPHYCIETDTIEIWVDVFISIEVNTVFTPNDDGINDYFEIKSTGLKAMEVNIFNQWGNRVYKIEEVNGKWDGNTDGGAKAPDGTYFYALTADGVDFKTYTRQGSVLLLRNATEIYPNPVEDNVRVKIYDQLQPPLLIEVYSAFGQLAHSEIAYDPQNIILDMKHLRSGMYMVKVSNNSHSYFARIIKK